jgi:hypothetical protein
MHRRSGDWEWYARFCDIAERHGLTRMLIPALAFLAGLPAEEQNCSALSKYDDFARFLRGFAR